MSVTTIANPTTTQLTRTLHDYNIHLTGSPSDTAPQSPETRPEPPNQISAPEVENPPNWPIDYRDVPPFRPADRERDPETRPGGTHPIERAFIFTMLHGVWLNATAAQTWRKTGGKINANIFRYAIGGEW